MDLLGCMVVGYLVRLSDSVYVVCFWGFSSLFWVEFMIVYFCKYRDMGLEVKE